MDLHNTRMGVDFFTYHFPEMVKTLTNIDKKLNFSNELKEREIRIKQQELNLRGQDLNPTNNEETMLREWFYEIQCYSKGHDKDYTYYIQSDKELDDDGVINKLMTEHIGVDGLELHHIENIVAIHPIDAERFTNDTGIPVESVKKSNNYKHIIKPKRSVTVNVTFEFDGPIERDDVKQKINQILQNYRDDVGFVFDRDADTFVEGIIVE